MWGSNQIAIDLGTTYTRIAIPGKGIVLEEPTVVTLDPKNKKVLAVGWAAKEMLGKSPQDVFACQPLNFGSIAHYMAAEALLRKFLQSALGKLQLSRPQIFISVPSRLNSVERRAVTQVLQLANPNKIHLIKEPVATAVGAGLPVHKPQGNLVINLGGGIAEIAILSLGGIVVSNSLKGGGEALNKDIIDYLRNKHQLLISNAIAERLKSSLGTAVKPETTFELEIKGRNSRTGLPQELRVSNEMIYFALQNKLREIVQKLQHLLEQAPAAVAADIMENGLALSGGGAQLNQVEQLFSNTLKLPAYIVDQPESTVINGLNIMLGDPEKYERLLSQ